MSLTVQSIADDAAYNFRLNLDGTGGSGTAFTILAKWVDQVHKDVLHSSVYAHHARKTTSVTSVAGTRSYTISATDLHRIEMVYDTVNQRELLPWDAIAAPTSSKDPKDLGAGTQALDSAERARRTQSIFPEYYRLATATSSGTHTHTLYLFPPPSTSSQAGNIDIHYEKVVSTVSASATVLELPESARDVMVAGVSWMHAKYLKREAEAQSWLQSYEVMKRGERILGA